LTYFCFLDFISLPFTYSQDCAGFLWLRRLVAGRILHVLVSFGTGNLNFFPSASDCTFFTHSYCILRAHHSAAAPTTANYYHHHHHHPSPIPPPASARPRPSVLAACCLALLVPRSVFRRYAALTLPFSRLPVSFLPRFSASSTVYFPHSSSFLPPPPFTVVPSLDANFQIQHPPLILSQQ
jgi:hypothetical protein